MWSLIFVAWRNVIVCDLMWYVIWHDIRVTISVIVCWIESEYYVRGSLSFPFQIWKSSLNCRKSKTFYCRNASKFHSVIYASHSFGSYFGNKINLFLVWLQIRSGRTRWQRRCKRGHRTARQNGPTGTSWWKRWSLVNTMLHSCAESTCYGNAPSVILIKAWMDMRKAQSSELLLNVNIHARTHTQIAHAHAHELPFMKRR